MAETFAGSVEALFKGMEEFITTKTVVGEPVYVKDTIILPLVDVTFGCAASAKNEPQRHNGGGGMGGGGAERAGSCRGQRGGVRLPVSDPEIPAGLGFSDLLRRGPRVDRQDRDQGEGQHQGQQKGKGSSFHGKYLLFVSGVWRGSAL